MSVELESLTEPVAVTLDDGRVVHPKPIDGFGYQLLAQQTDGNSINIMYRIAAKCLAGQLSKDEVVGTEDVQGLSATEIGRVIAGAQARVKTVEEGAAPNSAPAGVTRKPERV